MGSLSSTDLRKINIQIRLYKWEFLRRNAKYRKAFDQYSKKAEELQLGASVKYNKWEMRISEEFEKDWGISYPCDYREKTPTLFPIIREESLPAVSIVRHGEPFLLGDALIVKNGRTRRYPSVIGLRVNLNYPYTRVEVRVKEILGQLYKQRASIDERINPQFASFADMLKVWDLKTAQPKLKWPEVARKVFPGRVGKAEVVRKMYRTCQNYIDGEYRKIR